MNFNFNSKDCLHNQQIQKLQNLKQFKTPKQRLQKVVKATDIKFSGNGAQQTLEQEKLKESTEHLSHLQRVSVLAEAVPYFQKFRNKIVVVKYGGAAMSNETLKANVIKDLVLLSLVGIKPVLVHGGGPEINSWLKKVNIEPNFRNGFRVTDAATIEIVEMVLAGKVNKSLASLIQTSGGKAVGLCGKDGGLIQARMKSDLDIGYVGDVVKIDPSLLENLVKEGFIPVVSTVGIDSNGQSLNINADIAAGEIAASLHAEKLILMTDVPGVMRDKNDVNTVVRLAGIRDIRALQEEGVIQGGMIPKVECCISSIAQGVTAAHIIDGREAHSLLLEIFADDIGVGTMITR